MTCPSILSAGSGPAGPAARAEKFLGLSDAPVGRSMRSARQRDAAASAAASDPSLARALQPGEGQTLHQTLTGGMLGLGRLSGTLSRTFDTAIARLLSREFDTAIA